MLGTLYEIARSPKRNKVRNIINLEGGNNENF